ncbi:carbamoyltransferase [Streptomyces sp. NPDC001828]|uniref:carbamoyltransferase family protein n=1 Tax=Streptomyces sp. NPDC001828 TaxID=3364615 RepID=UPI0036B1F08E
MALVGVSCLAHDAGLAVLRNGRIVFASHSERYSRKKNDPLLNGALLDDALQHVDKVEGVVYYERPLLKRLRQARAGNVSAALGAGPQRYIQRFPALRGKPIHFVSHHESHAAGAYFTSPFRDAAVVVVDAIGEWDTLTVWHARNRRLRKVHSVRYPHSLGLFYSAVTQRAGLKPNEEEYILMGMAGYGKPRHRALLETELLSERDAPDFALKRSLHRGLGPRWHPEITEAPDLASSAQAVLEEFLTRLFRWVARSVPSKNLVYTGGVALNCLFNGRLAGMGLFDDIWIPPNPGDAGSALGALAAHTREFIPWDGPYLGHDIQRRTDPARIVDALLDTSIVGLANGRAEYGPRALGNRSLLADPRDPATKDKVNAIKKRQRYRPFAPVVLAEYADKIFEMPVREAPYMQYVVACREPEAYPAVCHVDGTSRVQTLRRDQNPLLHEVISLFHQRTGCPMLLNTSLNIRGQPLVNTWQDAQDFARKYQVPVF